MSQVERAVDYVKGRGYARTPELAQHLGMVPSDVELLLEEPRQAGLLICCDVELATDKVKEYRCSVSGGGTAMKFKPGRPPKARTDDGLKATLRAWRAPQPTPPGQASAAPTRPAHTPAAPVPGGTKEEPMAEQKNVAERMLDVLKGEAELHVEDIAKRAKTTKNSLSTIIGKIKGVRRTRRGFYALAGNQMLKVAPRQRDALAAGGELGRKNGSAPKTAGDSLYGAALLDLQEKREALVEQLAKLDRAIEAVGALA